MQRQRAVELDLETLALEQEGRVLTVRVQAPPHNYMTAAMQQDLLRLLHAVDADPGIGAVVVTGGVEGRYITHFDIADLLDAAEKAPLLPRPVARAVYRFVRAMNSPVLQRTPLAGVQVIVRFHQLVTGLARSRALWIGAIDGPCGGGGLEMSLFFDLRLASDRAAFIVPELSIGLTTTVGGQRLVQLTGPARALEMMLEARAYTAAEAHDMGLINRVVPAGSLVAEAQRLAALYARRPAQVVARQKQIINTAGQSTLRSSLEQEGVAQLTGVPTDGTRAALRRWLSLQAPDGDSTFLTDPKPFAEGTAVDFH
jgi:enoyl-CoA hydratase